MSSVEQIALTIWIILWGVAIVLFLIAAAWGFNVRRGMTVRMRRSLALGIALLALAVAWVALNFIINKPPPGNLAGDTYNFFQAILPPMLYFYWTDAAVLAARKTDPLLRDIWHWSRIRIGVWAILLFSVFFYLFVYLLYFDVILGKSILQVYNGSPFGNNLLNSVGSFWILALVVSPPFLIVAWRRSRDPTIRAHLKWFAFFALAIFLAGAIVVSTVLFPSTSLAFLFLADLFPTGAIIGGYFLYKSARSLVFTSPAATAIVNNEETRK